VIARILLIISAELTLTVSARLRYRLRYLGNAGLVQALTNRARLLGADFRSVVFAQVRISALNTALTGVYLLVIVPWLGIHLPFAKTMVVVTFITGLLPVIGNLISNTVIVVVSLSVSPI